MERGTVPRFSRAKSSGGQGGVRPLLGPKTRGQKRGGEGGEEEKEEKEGEKGEGKRREKRGGDFRPLAAKLFGLWELARRRRRWPAAGVAAKRKRRREKEKKGGEKRRRKRRKEEKKEEKREKKGGEKRRKKEKREKEKKRKREKEKRGDLVIRVASYLPPTPCLPLVLAAASPVACKLASLDAPVAVFPLPPLAPSVSLP